VSIRIAALEEWVMRRSLWSSLSLSAATSNPGQRRFHVLPVSLSPVRHRRRTPMALGRARCVGMAPHTTAPPTGIGQCETGAPLVWDQAGHRSAQTPVHRTLAPLRRGASPSASPNHGRRGKIPARRGGNKIVEHGVSLPERGITASLEASMDHWKPIFFYWQAPGLCGMMQ
jgi:hypothetical protein